MARRGPKKVSASTQNQALSAVLFLYKEVLELGIGPIEQVPRARVPDKVLVVLSREELARLLKELDDTMWLIVAMLYGTGVRLEECLALRVKDLDCDRNQTGSSSFRRRATVQRAVARG